MDVNFKAHLDVDQIKKIGKTLGAEAEEKVYVQFFADMITALMSELKDEGVHPEMLEAVATRIKADFDAVRKLLYGWEEGR